MYEVPGEIFGDIVPATVSTLQREIAREERLVGLRPDRPLTDAAIVRRHVQIGVLLGLLSLVAVTALIAGMDGLRYGTSAIALAFGAYALEKEHHLQRLALLHRDERSINLAVAERLLRSGELRTSPELLDARAAVERGADRLVDGLADLLPTDCARLRLRGPSGETPVAAERDLSPGLIPPSDPYVAREALRLNRSIRRRTGDGRTVLAVPLARHDDVVGVLEVVSIPGEHFVAGDIALLEAFALGAVSAVLPQ